MTRVWCTVPHKTWKNRSLKGLLGTLKVAQIFSKCITDTLKCTDKLNVWDAILSNRIKIAISNSFFGQALWRQLGETVRTSPLAQFRRAGSCNLATAPVAVGFFLMRNDVAPACCVISSNAAAASRPGPAGASGLCRCRAAIRRRNAALPGTQTLASAGSSRS